ncbi:protein-disulfide reductase DsbD family protein [Sphingomonas parva]|uniref:protein-disulfide reductase DsbD family protein n=1 Tax=Sphingomonas parva TaxID=2555898 RepID=UPI0021F06E1D|nr:thioredoxin family protein [Sphingomonas parva]
MTAGDPDYPVPQRLTVAGLMNYVYEGEYALLIDLAVPRGLAPGTMLPIRGKADYLVCTDQICVPESAELALDLKVGSGRGEPRFDRWREAMPRPLGSPARFDRAGKMLRIAIPLPAAVALDDPYFFPETEGAIDHSAVQTVSRTGDVVVIETPAGPLAPQAVDGVLGLGNGQGLTLRATPGPVPDAGKPVHVAERSDESVAAAILLALGGALLGGLLLNVMPCVFPILSLKALSLAKAGGEEKNVRREAMAYTLGVVGTCLALGAALLALRAGGAAAGWAFQLQDPRVILFLLLLVTAIALNLAGLFELPSLGGGGRLAESGGTAGAFWTGALAAFVATPCTGPFMGAALGAALVLPEAAALAIFAGLGLGLALPFLLLGFVPALRRRLPRPGPWMVRFRRVLSIPMFLTALGLAWILERQAGTSGVALGLGATVIVAAALWWAGNRHGWAALAPAVLAVTAALFLVPIVSSPAAARDAGELGAEPFSEQRLAALRAEGRPVFVYFTADWCVTCKVNEKAVLARDEVAEAFETRDVAVLVGDWTRGDAEIGRFLEKHDRSGVPLYLWYAPRAAAPKVLPQILTVGAVTGLVG